MTELVILIAGGVVGFFLGSLRFFVEQKHRAYKELLPPILKVGYHPQRRIESEEEFNQALTKLWLYASKGVAKKMNKAISIIHNQSRGDLHQAFKDAIIVMRRDLRPYRWQGLKPEDVAHIYTTMS